MTPDDYKKRNQCLGALGVLAVVSYIAASMCANITGTTPMTIWTGCVSIASGAGALGFALAAAMYHFEG